MINEIIACSTCDGYATTSKTTSGTRSGRRDVTFHQAALCLCVSLQADIPDIYTIYVFIVPRSKHILVWSRSLVLPRPRCPFPASRLTPPGRQSRSPTADTALCLSANHSTRPVPNTKSPPPIFKYGTDFIHSRVEEGAEETGALSRYGGGRRGKMVSAQYLRRTRRGYENLYPPLDWRRSFTSFLRDRDDEVHKQAKASKSKGPSLPLIHFWGLQNFGGGGVRSTLPPSGDINVGDLDTLRLNRGKMARHTCSKS